MGNYILPIGKGETMTTNHQIWRYDSRIYGSLLEFFREIHISGTMQLTRKGLVSEVKVSH